MAVLRKTVGICFGIGSWRGARLCVHRGLIKINAPLSDDRLFWLRPFLHDVRKSVDSPAAPSLGALVMLKSIAIVIVVAIVAVLCFAAMRPDTFRVQRDVGRFQQGGRGAHENR
jgi:hypothetical protein